MYNCTLVTLDGRELHPFTTRQHHQNNETETETVPCEIDNNIDRVPPAVIRQCYHDTNSDSLENIVLNQIKSILLLFFLGRVLLSIFRVNHNEAMGLIQLANFSFILHDIEGAD